MTTKTKSYMPKTKAALDEAKKLPVLKPRDVDPDDRPAVEVDLYRLLPCPNVVACVQFPSVHLQPPDNLQNIFLSIAIGPNLGDIHALGCFGYLKPEKEGLPPIIEAIQAFALSEQAYIALCEGCRATLMPLGFQQYAGKIHMISKTQPYRVIGSKDFYVHVEPTASVQ